jgi:hypothetical protein
MKLNSVRFFGQYNLYKFPGLERNRYISNRPIKRVPIITGRLLHFTLVAVAFLCQQRSSHSKAFFHSSFILISAVLVHVFHPR